MLCEEDKMALNLLKSKGRLTKRQIAFFKKNYHMDTIISAKYPGYLLEALSQEEQIMGFLSEL